jgi:host factor-I protein
MDFESRSLQNDFFNAARKEKATVTVFLGNGKRLTGRLKSFDKFTLLLEGHQGDQIIFKHAISTVSTCSRAAETTAEEPRRGRATPVAGQHAVQRAHD